MINVKATLNNLHNVLPDADVETLLKILDAIVDDNIVDDNIVYPTITYPYPQVLCSTTSNGW